MYSPSTTAELGREPINLQGFRLARVRYSPDSDQIPQRSVMSGRANRRHLRELEFRSAYP